MAKNRTLGVILFPGFAVLDVFGPLEFWNALSTSYNVKLALIANQTGLVPSLAKHSMPGGGMMNMDRGIGESINAEYDFETAPDLDILLVPGGMGTRNLAGDPSITNFIKSRYPQLEYLVSVCTGAALVAPTGLLDGKNATTNKFSYNWAIAQGPNVNWIPHARFVEDGNILTSSGVTAGMDLTYYFISKLYGRAIASRIANIIEYAPHTNAEWDPFSDLWLKNGTVTEPVSPCDVPPESTEAKTSAASLAVVGMSFLIASIV
eukprot:TRINITY_DN520_c0_g1_i1.p1 TRINITY_DN520_c0_g1~~TRINITY_DN520_c0_g1_i1.p1  ORF type:complete len:302 (+),score=41.57 TRINITY_DN520_c0_g1_i1:120-908(+)